MTRISIDFRCIPGLGFEIIGKPHDLSQQAPKTSVVRILGHEVQQLAAAGDALWHGVLVPTVKRLQSDGLQPGGLGGWHFGC